MDEDDLIESDASEAELEALNNLFAAAANYVRPKLTAMYDAESLLAVQRNPRGEFILTVALKARRVRIQIAAQPEPITTVVDVQAVDVDPRLTSITGRAN